MDSALIKAASPELRPHRPTPPPPHLQRCIRWHQWQAQCRERAKRHCCLAGIVSLYIQMGFGRYNGPSLWWIRHIRCLYWTGRKGLGRRPHLRGHRSKRRRRAPKRAPDLGCRQHRVEGKKDTIGQDFSKPAPLIAINSHFESRPPKITWMWESEGSQAKVGVPGVQGPTEQRANQCWPTG